MLQTTNYEYDTIPDVSELYLRMNEAKIKGDIEDILKCISAGTKLGHYYVIEHGYQSLEIARKIKKGEIDPTDRLSIWTLERDLKVQIPENVLKGAFPNAYRIRGCDLHVPYTSISLIYTKLFGEDFHKYNLNGVPYDLLDEDEKRIVNEFLIRQKLSSLGYQ